MHCVLYLVRHGAIIRPSGRAYIGQIDFPLSEEGVDQAWALREWLGTVPFSHSYASDLTRARRTCQIIAGAKTKSITTLPNLREINLGEWEGLSFREIEERYPEAYAERGRDMENWRPPGGESFRDCSNRVMSTLRETLSHAQGNVLVVGHAGVNRTILCNVLGIPLANLHAVGQDYGCVNIIDFSASRTRVRLINYTPVPASWKSPDVTVRETTCETRGRI